MMVVFVLRGQQVQRGIGFRLPNESDTVTTIRLVGRELAPNMVTRMVANYEREYPHLHVLVGDGGSVRALEAIANGQAGVGLLYRPPTGAEQKIIKDAVETRWCTFRLRSAALRWLPTFRGRSIRSR